jgi:hypothetical protein
MSIALMEGHHLLKGSIGSLPEGMPYGTLLRSVQCTPQAFEHFKSVYCSDFSLNYADRGIGISEAVCAVVHDCCRRAGWDPAASIELTEWQVADLLFVSIGSARAKAYDPAEYRRTYSDDISDAMRSPLFAAEANAQYVSCDDTGGHILAFLLREK